MPEDALMASNAPEDDDHNPEDSVETPSSITPKSDEETQQLVTQMFEQHHDRLLRMIEVRMQPELRSRVDSSDVLQESFIEALRQLRTGVSAPKYSTLVWLRLIVGQQLVSMYRRYFQTQKRDMSKECSIYRQRPQADPTSTSVFLVGQLTSPSVAARRHELIEKMRECLEQLSPSDREIISLRHFEQLSNKETAEELGVAPNAASVMYLRALKKFKPILEKAKLNEFIE